MGKTREERNAKARERYALNKEKERQRRIIYKAKYPEKVLAANRRNDARPERKARKAELERTEARKAMRKAYRARNPRTEYLRQWEKANRARRKELHNLKQQHDPQYRLRRTLRASLKNAIKHSWAAGSAVKNLDCSIDWLKYHLECQWLPQMSWENFGRLGKELTWQIDHIRPLSSFDLTDPNELAKACHWTNLAPLWALDNRRKANKVLGQIGGA